MVVGPDDNKYIVNEHVVPALFQDFKANEKKGVLKTFYAPGAVSLFSFLLHRTCVGREPEWFCRYALSQYPCESPISRISKPVS